MPRGTNPTLEIFLSLNFPWNDDHAQLWKSVTWTFIKDGKKQFANYAAQDFNGVMHLVESRAGRANADVYLALGTQRMATMDKLSADGYPKAERKIANVVSFNSIYLDIDVGKDGAYATTDYAFAALDDFCDKTGLPEPSMEVRSGSGGLHVYWCTKDPMPVAAWLPLATGLRDAALAYGLKFDPQCTVNVAGILRAPNTLNHKHVPPTKVQLMEDSSFARYEYQLLVGALGTHVGTLPGVRLNQPTARNQNFTAGVGVAAPVGLDDVIRVCPVFNDIEQRGGNGDAEPLWNLAMMVASFTEDPVDAAHRLSNGDPRYTHAETDKKLHEKLNARAANPAIGWPQCSSFSPLHSACQTCPLFAQNKSPLSFAKKLAPAQPVVLVGTDPLMPFGYWRDMNQHVFTTIIHDKTKVATVVDVLGYAILDAGIDGGNGELVFRTRIGGVEKWGSASVHANLQTTSAAQAMAKNGVFVMPANYKVVRDFLVSWMGHLQTMKKTIAPATYGWTDDGKGFTFDQTVYTPGGKDLVFRGSSHDPRFSAKGDLKSWQAAMKLVYGNATLEAVVASAFAAPLIDLIGSTSVVLSIYSAASGIGKTTSMMLAQAVWGDPRSGMSALADTNNSVMKKVADLKNLPIYWDELRTQDQLEKVIDLVFQITQGKAKSRLNKDITQAAAPAFTTMFVVASNYGISDNVYSQTDGTEAGGLRLFEIEAEERKSTTLADYEARQLQKTIEKNYGIAGAAYAEFLAVNKPLIQQIINAEAKRLNDIYKFGSKERFWAITIASLMVGARLANHAGLTSFDLAGIERCLDATMLRMRSNLKAQEYTTMANTGAGSDVLTEMLNDVRGRHLLITDKIHYGMGRPQIVDATATGDISRLGDVWMQFGEKDGKYRVRTIPFNKWLRERKKDPTRIVKLLEQTYHVTRGKQSIGAGVPFLNATASQRSECIDFTPLNPPGSNLGSS